MINIYSDDEIQIIKKAGHINYETHKYLASIAKPGVSTKYLDDEAGRFIESMGGKAASKTDWNLHKRVFDVVDLHRAVFAGGESFLLRGVRYWFIMRGSK